MNGVSIQNFRCLTDARLSFDDGVTLVLGPNGSGKSSIQWAIEYGLTGACDGTDRRGLGSEGLIRIGSKAAAVAMAIRETEIRRTIAPKANTVQCAPGGRTGEKAVLALESLLPPTPVLRAMLRSDGFIGLPGKEQQAILFSLAGETVDSAWYRARLEADQQETLSEALAVLLEGPELAGHLHSAAYGMRTEANRAVKELEAQVKAGGQEDEVPLPASVGELQTVLRTARNALNAANQKLGEGRASVETRDAARARWDDARAGVERAQRELDEHGSEDEAPSVERIAEVSSELEAVVNGVNTAKARRQTLTGALNAVSTQLAAFEALKGRCVLGTMECPLAGETREAVIEEARIGIEQREAEIAVIDQALERSEGQQREIVARLQGLTDARQAAGEWAERERYLREALTEKRGDVATALAAYQAIKAPVLEALESGVETAQKRVDGLTRQLADAEAIQGAQAGRRKLESDLEAAKARAAHLDALVKRLSPDGLPAEATRSTIGLVLEGVNRVLSEFSEWELQAEPGKDFELVIARSGGQRIPVRLLSESERLRVGIAIQVAFAHLTEFGFVVVDGADRMDAETFPGVVGMLLEAGIKALVLATPRNGRRPSAEGLRVYELAEGRVVEVKAEAEVAA